MYYREARKEARQAPWSCLSIGHINQTKMWVLKALLAAIIAGSVGSVPFSIADDYLPGCVKTDPLINAAFLAIPALAGFATGRYWLTAMSFWAILYSSTIWAFLQDKGVRLTDAQTGLAAAVLLAGTMSFLSSWWKLRKMPENPFPE